MHLSPPQIITRYQGMATGVSKHVTDAFHWMIWNPLVSQLTL